MSRESYRQELSYIQSQGLYVREKCDGCGAILNQSVRYTIAGKAEVYCSAKCRDAAFFEDRLERRSGAILVGVQTVADHFKRRGAAPFTAMKYAEKGMARKTGVSLQRVPK